MDSIDVRRYNVVDSNAFFGFYSGRRVDSSLEKLLALMKAYGVSKSVTSSLRGVFYDFHEGNDETLMVCSSRRELIPAAIIDPRKYVGCLDEVDERVSQGFKLFRFFPQLSGVAHGIPPPPRDFKEA